MQYDIIIIGSGPGGYVAALHGAQQGLKTVIVEREHLGGICLNWGCIPTKALLQSAHLAQDLKKADGLGFHVRGYEVDMARIVARSREVASNMSKGVRYLLDKAKIEVVTGEGVLRSSNEVEVHQESGERIVLKGKHIIIATGARTRELPNIPLDGRRVIGYREALTLDHIPESMAIIGSGAIGCEMAEFYNALGTKITLIEALPSLMPLVDEDISNVVGRSFRKAKVKTMVGALVERIEVGDTGCTLHVRTKKGEEQVEAEIVLSAVGITPNTEHLGLETVGVRTDRGKILTDAYGQTNIAGIYAIGDVTTTPALAHVASAEASIAVDHILGKTPDTNALRSIPSCTYTTPEVASVGRTERQLQEEAREYFVGNFPFTASGKATAMGQRDGFIKLLFDKGTRELLGAHIVGANATELISELCLALSYHAKPEDIYHVIHPHPTLGESVMEAAMQADGVSHHV